MPNTTPTNDGTETDRALWRLVGLVVIAAFTVLITAIAQIKPADLTTKNVWTMLGLALVCVVASLTKVSVRLRSTTFGFIWADVSFLIIVILLPSGLALPTVSAAALTYTLIQRRPMLRVAIAAGKDTL